MAEQPSARGNDTSNTDSNSNPMDLISDMASHVRSEIDHLVEGIDFQEISQKIESYGRANPIGLAVTALLVGVAAGILMRNPPEFPHREI